MALADNETRNTEKPELNKASEKREKPLTKVVIRRLPPGITQESFITQVSPIPDYNYIYTVKGDMTLGEFSFSRVYINFCNAEDVYPFKEKFDNYVFVDTKGHEYAAVVEFSSFQKVPKRRGKPRSDPKCGTIENDNIYLEFLESLKSQPNQDEKPEYSYQPSLENKNDASTPLLEFIKQRRIDRQRIREEKKEERKKRDFERKKIKDDERRKHYEEKSPNKSSKTNTSISKSEELKEKAIDDKQEDKVSDKTTEKGDYAYEKSTSVTYRNRKFDDRKPSTYKTKMKYGSRVESSDYYERRDSYKSRREEKEKEYKKKVYDDSKKDTIKSNANKKIKKYSERREELKAKQCIGKQGEAKDLEQEETKEFAKREEKATSEESFDKSKEQEEIEEHYFEEIKKSQDECNLSQESCSDLKMSDKESRHKSKDNDPRLQRRIRNKDRPTMALYQPGMLRKKHSEGSDSESKPCKSPSIEKE